MTNSRPTGEVARNVTLQIAETDARGHKRMRRLDFP